MRKKLIKSEVVKLFNTTKETLRHYEQIGLINPERDDSHYRFYDIEEIKLLRQIFFLKDLGLSLDQIKAVMFSKSEELQYYELLDSHNKALTGKIKHLQTIQKNTALVLKLIKGNTFSLSFRLAQFKERTFYAFNPFESAYLDSLKAYYDEFKELISSDYYSERLIMSLFSYQTLDAFKKESSRMCLEIDMKKLTSDFGTKGFEILTLRKGLYLSVFYIFNENRFDELKELKDRIDLYLKENNLIVEEDEVIEIEHPELGMMLESGMTVYEIQIKIKIDHEKNSL